MVRNWFYQPAIRIMRCSTAAAVGLDSAYRRPACHFNRNR
jgi:hypothetical protein